MILRGRQKKMIVLKRTGSPYFEEAYFILREGEGGASVSENDMAAEAERIISRMNANRERENAKKIRSGEEGKLTRALWFLYGAASGIVVSLIVGAVAH
ncbi:MAG: hypothetical protein IJR90_01920 [Clostridia bacterium]|nr:hypothetical protein [Clostridia bacterium]